jgi:hypothetical protein
MSEVIHRAGVVIRCTTPTGINLNMMGLDGPTNERGDWGGKVEKWDKDPFCAASRELGEETLKCVSIPPERVAKGTVIQANGVLISFVHVEVEELLEYLVAIEKAFEAARKSKQRTEMRGAKLLTDEEVLRSIDNGSMYYVVADVLRKNQTQLFKHRV